MRRSHSSIWRSYDYMDQKQTRLDLIKGYQEWVRIYVDEGWKPYEISFMYQQLPGSRDSILEQMKQELYRINSKLVTRFHRDPRSRAGFECLPRMMLFPDLPVYKHQKKSIEDVSINDGLHYGGIALTPPISRCKTRLDRYFRNNHDDYLSNKLARIFVEPITHAHDYVTDYVMKTIKSGRLSQDDVVILPRCISELSDRG
jgi:hypothetical protein